MNKGSPPTSLYRYYDAHRVLIYVGITKRGVVRNTEHNTGKSWWPYVAHQVVEHFTTRELAHARERELIKRYTPPCNVQHNPDHREMRSAYLAAVAAAARSPYTVRDGAQALGRKLPLSVVARESFPCGMVLTLRTELAHACIAAVLRCPPNLRATAEHGNVAGQVIGVERRGPFALIKVHVRQSYLDREAAIARIKTPPCKGDPDVELVKLNFLAAEQEKHLT